MALVTLLVCGAAVAASASPLASQASALATAAPTDLVDVRYRGRAGGAVVAGVALGIIGALAATAASRPYYYGPYYYAPPYYYGPVYAAPVYGHYSGGPVYAAPPLYVRPRVRAARAKPCWVQAGPFPGQGYWTRCYR